MRWRAWRAWHDERHVLPDDEEGPRTLPNGDILGLAATLAAAALAAAWALAFLAD